MLPICGACAEAAHTNSAIAKVRVTLIRRWAPPYCCGDSAPCLLLRELPDDGQYDGFALIGCDDQPQPQQETGQLEKPVQTVEAPKPINPENANFDFNRKVRQKGNAWLQNTPDARTRERPQNYWSDCLPHLRQAFRGLCAYAAMKIESKGTVDHFRS